MVGSSDLYELGHGRKCSGYSLENSKFSWPSVWFFEGPEAASVHPDLSRGVPVPGCHLVALMESAHFVILGISIDDTSIQPCEQ